MLQKYINNVHSTNDEPKCDCLHNSYNEQLKLSFIVSQILYRIA